MSNAVAAIVVVMALFGGCTLDPSRQAATSETEAAPTAAPATPESNDDVGPDGESLDPDDEGRPPADPNAPKPEPVPYVPAGQPGNAAGYADLIARLEGEIPAELRTEVPWPDLRNPNPIVAQIEIFELWIWMEEHYPEPVLVEAMAAPGSPSREEITGIFGRIDRQNMLQIRRGAGYEAFEHLVVTFESAGLPLWLARDVPKDAVVVYYSDNSGPIDIVDRDTEALIEIVPGSPTRTWLSIMVPTDVGWQLWRDQLIEPNDAELEVPDVPPPPGADEDQRKPEV